MKKLGGTLLALTGAGLAIFGISKIVKSNKDDDDIDMIESDSEDDIYVECSEVEETEE